MGGDRVEGATVDPCRERAGGRRAMSVVWIDGELVDERDAVVAAGDHGVTVGDGLFETMKVVDGTAFAVRRHLARLRRTAAGLGLALPMSDGELRAALATTIEANRGAGIGVGVGVGKVRLTITGGPAPRGSMRGAASPTVIVHCGPPSQWAPAAVVVTVPWPRNERGALAGLKTTSYAENVVALQHALDAGADEALFANTVGNLCEGTGTNVFVAVDGRLRTPPLSAGCLAGVTRELLLELDLPVDEVDVPMSALAEVDEAFLASSTRDVQPI